MLSNPLLFAILSMLSWGVWSVFAKVSLDHYSTPVLVIVSNLFTVTLAGLYFVTFYDKDGLSAISTDFRHVLLLALTGLANGIAVLAYYHALTVGGAVSMVATIESLYFVVAAVLGLLVLGETIVLREALAILLAATSVLLFSTT